MEENCFSVMVAPGPTSTMSLSVVIISNGAARICCGNSLDYGDVVLPKEKMEQLLEFLLKNYTANGSLIYGNK